MQNEFPKYLSEESIALLKRKNERPLSDVALEQIRKYTQWDYSYSYSDDASVYRSGRAHEERLTADLQAEPEGELKELLKELFRNIYNHHEILKERFPGHYWERFVLPDHKDLVLYEAGITDEDVNRGKLLLHAFRLHAKDIMESSMMNAAYCYQAGYLLSDRRFHYAKMRQSGAMDARLYGIQLPPRFEDSIRQIISIGEEILKTNKKCSGFANFIGLRPSEDYFFRLGAGGDQFTGLVNECLDHGGPVAVRQVVIHLRDGSSKSARFEFTYAV